MFTPLFFLKYLFTSTHSSFSTPFSSLIGSTGEEEGSGAMVLWNHIPVYIPPLLTTYFFLWRVWWCLWILKYISHWFLFVYYFGRLYLASYVLNALLLCLKIQSITGLTRSKAGDLNHPYMPSVCRSRVGWDGIIDNLTFTYIVLQYFIRGRMIFAPDLFPLTHH